MMALMAASSGSSGRTSLTDTRFLDNVAWDLYVPDLAAPLHPRIASPDGRECLDASGKSVGDVSVRACSGAGGQAWVHSSAGHLQVPPCLLVSSFPFLFWYLRTLLLVLS
jgi:hypothetical protein